MVVGTDLAAGSSSGECSGARCAAASPVAASPARAARSAAPTTATATAAPCLLPPSYHSHLSTLNCHSTLMVLSVRNAIRRAGAILTTNKYATSNNLY